MSSKTANWTALFPAAAGSGTKSSTSVPKPLSAAAVVDLAAGTERTMTSFGFAAAVAASEPDLRMGRRGCSEVAVFCLADSDGTARTDFDFRIVLKAAAGRTKTMILVGLRRDRSDQFAADKMT